MSSRTNPHFLGTNKKRIMKFSPGGIELQIYCGESTLKQQTLAGTALRRWLLHADMLGLRRYTTCLAGLTLILRWDFPL